MNNGEAQKKETDNNGEEKEASFQHQTNIRKAKGRSFFLSYTHVVISTPHLSREYRTTREEMCADKQAIKASQEDDRHMHKKNRKTK